MYERNYHVNVLKETTTRKPAKKIFPWKRIVVIVASVLLVGGFVVATKLTHLQVNTVNVVGTNSADPKDVSVFTLEMLEGNWLYFFPKSSIVLLPDHTLEKRIKASFPRFKTVSVARSGTQTITVDVSEYEGVYVWCDDAITACSFMSATGAVFAPAPFFSGSAYPKLFKGTFEGYPFYPMSDTELSGVTFMIDRLKAINIEPSEFRFYQSPQKLEIVFYHNGAPSKIILDSTIAWDTSLQSLFTVLRTAPFSGQYRNDALVLSYVDIRLPNKVVYRFK